MYRRDFLKLNGLLSVALFMQFSPLGKVVSFPLEVEAQGRLYRGTSDGKIHVSRDAGKSWQLHTKFGSDLSIQYLSVNFWGQVKAELGFAGHSFELVLAETGHIWQTI